MIYPLLNYFNELQAKQILLPFTAFTHSPLLQHTYFISAI